MFNLGPMEVLVLVIVGVVVIGPEKLPNLMRDAARMLKTLRDLATGARQQLRDELGPEFADVDFRNLNPRTAVQRMVFGDDDISDYNPRNAMRNAILGEEDREALRNADPRRAFRETRDSYYDASDSYDSHDSYDSRDSHDEPVRRVNGANGHSGSIDMSKPVERPAARSGDRPRPRPRPSYGDDVT